MHNKTFWMGLYSLLTIVAMGMLFFFFSSSYNSAFNYTPNLSRGKTLYVEACASCHGANLQGEANWGTTDEDGLLPAPPLDATGYIWHHSDRVLLDIVTRGTEAVVGKGYQSNMPGFGDRYTENELRAVLEWIKSQWPDRERTIQAMFTAQDQG